MCQVLVKVARSMESFKEDNFVDGAAYFAIACELADIALRQGKPSPRSKDRSEGFYCLELALHLLDSAVDVFRPCPIHKPLRKYHRTWLALWHK